MYAPFRSVIILRAYRSVESQRHDRFISPEISDVIRRNDPSAFRREAETGVERLARVNSPRVLRYRRIFTLITGQTPGSYFHVTALTRNLSRDSNNTIARTIALGENAAGCAPPVTTRATHSLSQLARKGAYEINFLRVCTAAEAGSVDSRAGNNGKVRRNDAYAPR